MIRNDAHGFVWNFRSPKVSLISRHLPYWNCQLATLWQWNMANGRFPNIPQFMRDFQASHVWWREFIAGHQISWEAHGSLVVQLKKHKNIKPHEQCSKSHYHSMKYWLVYRDSPFLDDSNSQHINDSIIFKLIIKQQRFWSSPSSTNTSKRIWCSGRLFWPHPMTAQEHVPCPCPQTGGQLFRYPLVIPHGLWSMAHLVAGWWLGHPSEK